MSELATAYSGRILKRNAGQNSMSGTDAASPENGYANIPTEQLREVILAEAQREADQLRARRAEELDAEIERAVASHVMTATRELNLSIAAASADIAKVVETAVRRIIGEKPGSRILADVVRQAVRERNITSAATITIGREDFPRLELARLAADKNDELSWLKIIEDETMAAGRVILTVNGKNYDISLENQLEALKSALQLDPETLNLMASA